MSLKQHLSNDMKAAMRAKDKVRLGTIRLILAEIQRKEVDGQTTLSDVDVVAVLTKMVKQRQDSIQQFTHANRLDLVSQEQVELDLIQTYLPQPLSEATIDTLISEALLATGANTPADMGKVMKWLKPKVQGQADIGKLSGIVKNKLQG